MGRFCGISVSYSGKRLAAAYRKRVSEFKRLACISCRIGAMQLSVISDAQVKEFVNYDPVLKGTRSGQ